MQQSYRTAFYTAGGWSVVVVCHDTGYVVKQCPRIVMNKIFDWH